MNTKTLREQAEGQVRDGLCGSCDAIGCNNESICTGFQKDVEEVLKEWALEDAGRYAEASEILTDLK